MAAVAVNCEVAPGAGGVPDTAIAVTELADAALARGCSASRQRIRYAELTCTPHTSVLSGVQIEAFTEAIEDAQSV